MGGRRVDRYRLGAGWQARRIGASVDRSQPDNRLLPGFSQNNLEITIGRIGRLRRVAQARRIVAGWQGGAGWPDSAGWRMVGAGWQTRQGGRR